MGHLDTMETPIADDQTHKAPDNSATNGVIDQSAGPFAAAEPPWQEDHATEAHDHGAEKNKKWGIGSILSRARSDSLSPQAEPAAAPAAALPPAKSGWFGSRKGRHSRPSSADPVAQPPPAKPAADVPIVGGLPLVAGPAPGDAAHANGALEGDSPRRLTSVSGKFAVLGAMNAFLLSIGLGRSPCLPIPPSPLPCSAPQHSGDP